MQSCIYSCSPLNVVDLIVDIMFIIDILINFRSDTFKVIKAVTMSFQLEPLSQQIEYDLPSSSSGPHM